MWLSPLCLFIIIIAIFLPSSQDLFHLGIVSRRLSWCDHHTPQVIPQVLHASSCSSELPLTSLNPQDTSFLMVCTAPSEETSSVETLDLKQQPLSNLDLHFPQHNEGTKNMPYSLQLLLHAWLVHATTSVTCMWHPIPRASDLVSQVRRSSGLTWASIAHPRGQMASSCSRGGRGRGQMRIFLELPWIGGGDLRWVQLVRGDGTRGRAETCRRHLPGSRWSALWRSVWLALLDCVCDCRGGQVRTVFVARGYIAWAHLTLRCLTCASLFPVLPFSFCWLSFHTPVSFPPLSDCELVQRRCNLRQGGWPPLCTCCLAGMWTGMLRFDRCGWSRWGRRRHNSGLANLYGPHGICLQHKCAQVTMFLGTYLFGDSGTFSTRSLRTLLLAVRSFLVNFSFLDSALKSMSFPTSSKH